MEISPKTEAIGIRLLLRPLHDAMLYPQYMTGLHAWFLQQVKSLDPALSQILHDDPEQKAFALSRLSGDLVTSGQRLQLAAHSPCTWTITLFSSSGVGWLRQWLQRSPKHLGLRQANFEITAVEIALPPLTYAQLFQPTSDKSLSFSFLSPTSFRRKGHHFPLPLPTTLFQSYLRRWNQFSGMPYDLDPFLAWIDDHILILRHELKTDKVLAAKQGAVTGFVGSIEYGLASSARQHPGYVQLLYALARYAPYCGTGHKTTFGLGQTVRGWRGAEEVVALPPELALTQRIQTLTEGLLAAQKRTGGDRATQVCQTRATILARREMGESLTAIAEDLAIPYETVKCYAKIARRILRS